MVRLDYVETGHKTVCEMSIQMVILEDEADRWEATEVEEGQDMAEVASIQLCEEDMDLAVQEEEGRMV